MKKVEEKDLGDVSVREECLRRLFAFPSPDLEVAQLTERDLIAIAAVAGCAIEMELVQEGSTTFYVGRTRNRIGVIKTEGKFRVFEEKGTAGSCLKVNLSSLRRSA